jgi:hypothetical protein
VYTKWLAVGLSFLVDLGKQGLAAEAFLNELATFLPVTTLNFGLPLKIIDFTLS